MQFSHDLSISSAYQKKFSFDEAIQLYKEISSDEKSLTKYSLAVIAMNTEPPPTKGSKYLLKAGTFGRIYFSSFSFPPGHFNNGLSPDAVI